MSRKNSTSAQKGILTPIVCSDFYDQEIRSLGGLVDVGNEGIDNSADAGADNILITHDKNEFIISDNGSGMSPDGMTAYVSMRMSTSRGDAGKKGRIGKGSKFSHGVFEEHEIMTIWDGNPEVVTVFRFTPSQLKEALFGKGQIPFESYSRKKVLNCPITKTGTVITMRKFLPRKYMSPNEVMKKLSERLSPDRAKKVKYNGQPLPERKIIGTLIDKSARGLAILGDITASIYLPEKVTRHDRLTVTAFGSGCDFKTLLANMPDTVSKGISPIFGIPNVCGNIDTSNFNDYLTDNRDGFVSDLFYSDAFPVFVDWINMQLAPIIEQNMGMIEQREDELRIERTLLRITEEINKAYGYRPGGAGKEVKIKFISTNVRDVELELGTETTFRVTNWDSECSGEFVWDDSNCGGIISPKEGIMVTYKTGNEEGNYKLAVCDKNDPEKKTIIYIRLVKEKQFKTSPSKVTLEPHESTRIMVRNPGVTSKDLQWEPSESGGKISSSSGLMIEYTAGSELGTFCLKVFDRKNTSIKAICEINIVSEKPKKPKPPGVVGEFKIRETVFRLGKLDFPKSSQTSFLTSQLTYHSLNINIGHLSAMRAQEKSDEMFRQYVFEQILFWYGTIAIPGITGDLLLAQLGEVRKEIIQGIKKKK